MRKYYFIFFTILSLFSSATQLSNQAQVSLLTCGTGEEMYALFGHSALRIKDPSLGIDIVFNYGTFDFDTPDFYLKFTQGKLLYSLSLESFESFYYSYVYSNRSINEQVLNLSPKQKQSVFNLLENNYLPENRYYKYDFFFDNCSTRIRDILDSALGDKLVFPIRVVDSTLTCRQLLERSLHNSLWTTFGIELLLGYDVDDPMTKKQVMFIPKFMALSFATSSINDKPFVLEDNSIYNPNNNEAQQGFVTPIMIFSLVLLLSLLLTFFNANKSLAFFDAFFFSTLGLVGIVIAFLWFASEHLATQDNLNLLWISPIHLLTPVLMAIKKAQNFKLRFYSFMALFSLLLILFWFVLPQEINLTDRILIFTIGYRYYQLYKIEKNKLILN